jgi:hypothetical protein
MMAHQVPTLQTIIDKAATVRTQAQLRELLDLMDAATPHSTQDERRKALEIFGATYFRVTGALAP